MQYIIYLMLVNKPFKNMKEVFPSINVGDRPNSDLGLFKTHYLCSQFPKECKKVYMIRNPFDVCVSQYHHINKFGQSMEDFVSEFISGTAGRFGGWKEHTEDVKSCENTLVVKYEDLVSDFGTTISKLAQFLVVNMDNDQKKVIEDQTSFKNMKAETEKLSPLPGRKDFFRIGKVGNYEQELSVDQIKQIEAYEKS